MTVLEDIRPRAEHLSDGRSAQLLDEVLTCAGKARRPLWRRPVALVALTGALVGGGTAYAAGLVPDIVSNRFQEIRGGGDGWDRPITDERRIADVLLSNGRHARIWVADTPGGHCEIRDMTDRARRPGDLAVMCAVWNDGEADDPQRGGLWQTSPTGPAVAYGEFSGVRQHIVEVRVDGPGWTRTFTVAANAFAGEVPAGADGDTVRLTYLDAAGQVVAATTRKVVIESE